VVVHRVSNFSQEPGQDGYLDGERGVVSASGSLSVTSGSNTAAASALKAKSESMKMLSLGAKPAADVLEWAQQTEEDPMPVFFNLEPICNLVDFALKRDFAASGKQSEKKKKNPATVDAATHKRIVDTCHLAASPQNYCEYVKSEEGLATMTCKPAKGGPRRQPKTPECTTMSECREKKSSLHSACYQNECVMKYKRIVDIAMVASSDSGSGGRAKVQCANEALVKTLRGGKGVDYEVVKVSGDLSSWTGNGWLNQIRGGDTGVYIRLCVKYSDKPVVMEDPKSHGVCQVQLQYGGSCSSGGQQWDPVTLAGESDGSFTQLDSGPSIRMCISYDGCEGREEYDASNPKKALTSLAVLRGDAGGCPPGMRGGQRVWINGVGTGNLNDVWNGDGSAWMCQSTA